MFLDGSTKFRKRGPKVVGEIATIRYTHNTKCKKVVNKWVYRTDKKKEIALSDFLSVFIFKFYIWLSRLSSEKVECNLM